MKNKQLISIVFLIQCLIYTNSTHAAKVSISTTSFLPYALEAVYLDNYAFPSTMINEQNIPNKKYEIRLKQYRNQSTISTGQFVQIKPSKTEQQISLVIFPDGQIINTSSHGKITSSEMLPENRYEKLAQQKLIKLRSSIQKRDKLGLITPDLDLYNVTESESNNSLLTNNANQQTHCTGTFKIQDNDPLSYLTSNDSNITFSYLQKNQLLKVYFAQTSNDVTQPIIGRKINFSSNFDKGIRFDLSIEPTERLTDINVPLNMYDPSHFADEPVRNFKVKARLYMTTKQNKKYLIMHHTLFYQELCSFKKSSLFYHKKSWTRFIDKITPDISWK